MAEPTFYYDFSSPYAYLAANRIDRVLGEGVRWQPILFGALLHDIGKVPWSWRLGPARDAEMEGCVARAEALGLPLRWPRDWPRGTYSIAAPRAALAAAEHGKVRAFSLSAFHHGLGRGRDLSDVEVVLDAAEDAGLDREQVRARVADRDIKNRLRDATDAAVRLGITGVPTVEVGAALFWGDDRLEDAAAAAGDRSRRC